MQGSLDAGTQKMHLSQVFAFHGVYTGMNGKPSSRCEKIEKRLQCDRFHSSVLFSRLLGDDRYYFLPETEQLESCFSGWMSVGFHLRYGVDEGHIEGSVLIQYKLALK